MNLVRHHGHRPAIRMRLAWSNCRIIGEVIPEVFFRAGLFATQEAEGEGNQGKVMMPADPAPALEVVEPKFVFELAVVLLDLPATAGGTNRRAQGRRRFTGWVPEHPVVAGFGGILWPFDQQRFWDA